jgi:hypothetical protein
VDVPPAVGPAAQTTKRQIDERPDRDTSRIKGTPKLSMAVPMPLPKCNRVSEPTRRPGLDGMLARWEGDHDRRGDGATSASEERRSGISAGSRP